MRSIALALVARTAAAATAVVGVDAHVDVGATQTWRSRNITALRRLLLDGYDRHEVPPIAGEAPERGVRVGVQMALNHFTSIDVSTQSMGFFAWWRHDWSDPRLAWDPDDWAGVTELSFVGVGPSKEVWTPDDTVYDATETEYLVPDTLVNVYHTGGVTVSLPISTTIPCPMKLRRFPFDVQECTFTHGSWTLNGVDVDVAPKVVDGDFVPFVLSENFEPHTEYEILHVKTEHLDAYYGCCPEPYPVITYAFRFRRHSITYISGILMPMILSTLVGMLAFNVNPGSGERISLGITVMLTNAAIYIVAYEVLPKGGDWSALAYVHVASFCFAMVTLAVSLVSVSLYCVKPAHGCRESDLLYSFVRADWGYGCDAVDRRELRAVVGELGLSPTTRVHLFATLDGGGGGGMTLDEWYDVVAKIYDQTHLAAYHSFFYSRLLIPLIHRERARRKESVLKRIRNASVVEGDAAAARAGARLRAAAGGAAADGDGDESPRAAPRAAKRPSLPTHGVQSSDLIDEHGDIADPTEYVARRLAGKIDFVFSALLPAAYVVIICVLLRPFDEHEGVFQDDWKCTSISHVHDGDRVWHARC